MSIGTDRGREQENRALKVLGGIKGIANSSQNLNEYFLSANKISNISKFRDRFCISEDQPCKWKTTSIFWIEEQK